jgi:hypothetical protein
MALPEGERLLFFRFGYRYLTGRPDRENALYFGG